MRPTSRFSPRRATQSTVAPLRCPVYAQLGRERLVPKSAGEGGGCGCARPGPRAKGEGSAGGAPESRRERGCWEPGARAEESGAFRRLRSPFIPYKSPYQRLSGRMLDISGDQGVLKDVIREGAGELVTPEASVLVKYSGYLEHMDKPFDSNCYRRTPRLMKLGEDITLWGMELGLLSMRKGELARFLFKPTYAYGTLGCPPLIPPNTTVLFEIELLDFLDSAESDKFCALSAALLLLRRRSAPTDEQPLVASAKLLVLLNLSFTYLKLERPTTALHYGEQALLIDQKNAKALFRCGQACVIMTEYQKARDFLVRAQKEQPFNHDINNELRKLASTAEASALCLHLPVSTGGHFRARPHTPPPVGLPVAKAPESWSQVP
ncbi:Inactive peptidyl-prolyl cis-trans isomerase FKBP6 [Galemys pyrenaicus]|uniref:peptidylprolyl isomerase n=1 Tax=Galemys pyrenaicus TaxID=202257 RepID=A0A8J5ZZH0_GALPY|nr:Inactive peptidyl-prolyl cis-trans isomerase FKBP6 [Galemys pyrenaicus]